MGEVIIEKMKLNKKFKINIDVKTYMMIIALIGIWGIFTFATGGSFLSPRNISNLFRQSVFTSVLAIGMVLIIIMGEIDLSVGSLVGLAGGIVAICDVWLELNPILSILITLLVGALLGLWNGWWIAYKRVPSFIVTLGGYLIFRGVLVGVTNGTTIGPMSNTFRYLGKGYVSPFVGLAISLVVAVYLVYYQRKTRKKKLAYGFDVLPAKLEFAKKVITVLGIVIFVFVMNAYRGISVSILLLLFLAAIFFYITKNTVFGRHIYAIGGNEEAAQLSGIKIKKTMLMVFLLNGLLAAIGGILLTSRLNAASVAAGNMAELDAIASCVIGGASLSGGVGSVIGAIIGAVVMASLDNGMSLLNTPMFWQSIVKGLVLIAAVWADVSMKK
jgi:D-xylose transport system permease protein